MGNYSWITGTQRFTAGGTLGRSGNPKRVFFATMASNASTGGVVTLHNATDAASTANIYATMEGNAGSGNVFDLGEMYMPNGCYVSLGAGSGTQYVVIQYHEDK